MISWKIVTNVGVVRSENQDKAAVFKKNDIVFAVLCDGMGGHKGGSHASRIAIDVFEAEFAKTFPFNFVAEKPKDHHTILMDWYYATLKKMKKQMTSYAANDAPLMDMGTTVVSAIILGHEVIIYNIGDSRAYIYNGLLQQITVDHNIRNYYIKEYGYSDEEAAKMHGAAALTSALGPTKRTEVEQFVIDSPTIKYIVLTSDGIHDYIQKQRFESIVGDKSMTMQEKLERIISSAIKGKSSDNLTGVLVDLEGGQ